VKCLFTRHRGCADPNGGATVQVGDVFAEVCDKVSDTPEVMRKKNHPKNPVFSGTGWRFQSHA